MRYFSRESKVTERGYQLDFSVHSPSAHDLSGRRKKASTMVAVLSEFYAGRLCELDVLDVGASTGIIDCFLADHFYSVTGIDIDKPAIDLAERRADGRTNLAFQLGDAMDLQFPDASFDVVICSHVYEHVPSAHKMMDEIYRVLKPGGVCYFSGSNRFRWMEPHYNLPLLSVIPRPLAHLYLKLLGRGDFYHELHFSYWGLKRLVRRFKLIDYSLPLISTPEKYGVSYMVVPGSWTHKIAVKVAKYLYCLLPGYIWVLQKPRSAGSI